MSRSPYTSSPPPLRTSDALSDGLKPAAELSASDTSRTLNFEDRTVQRGNEDGFETVSEDEQPVSRSSTSSTTARRRPAPRKVPRSPVKRARASKRVEHQSQPRHHVSYRAELPPLVEHFVVRPLEIVLLVLWRLGRLLLSPLLDAARYTLYWILALFVLLWLIQQPVALLRQALINPFALVPPIAMIPRIMIKAPKVVYCSTVGIGCKRTYSKAEKVALLARSTSAHAFQAHDIFQSVVGLGDPTNLGLHHAQIWTLAVAVRASSTLETREELGMKLKVFGDAARDVKDHVIRINARAISAFTWTVERFKRVELMIGHMQKSGSYGEETISKQLDALYDHLGRDLNEVLELIETAIPHAEQASVLGKGILSDFTVEQMRLQQQKEDTPLWRHLLDSRSYKGKQLSRDISLTTDSIRKMESMVTHLEDARNFLISYRDNAAHFTAGIEGMHLADNLLLPEHEVEALKSIMGRLTSSVDAVKSGNYKLENPPRQINDKSSSLWNVD